MKQFSAADVLPAHRVLLVGEPGELITGPIRVADVVPPTGDDDGAAQGLEKVG